MKKVNPLLDQDFLRQLDKQKNKVIYAKIISLTLSEYPQEEITGKVTSGSINIDGASAVRRTCSLSLIANDINLKSFYWGLNTKFKLFIGVENTINSEYPNIIWFPQGVYVITSFSSSQSLNSYNINISGKDKMANLNGELGGVFTVQTILHEKDVIDSNKVTRQETLLLKDIIYKMVSELGQQPVSKIIINDLDDYGIEILKYKGTTPLYLLFDKNNEPYQVYTNGNQTVYWVSVTKNEKEEEIETKIEKTFNELSSESAFKWNMFYQGSTGQSSEKPSKIQLSDSLNSPKFTVSKILYNDLIGYRLTDITFAGELIANVGETITSVLDKIKNQLGDFEYFFDLEGNFIFQRNQNYVNVSWTPVAKAEDNTGTMSQYVIPNQLNSDISYDFQGNDMTISLSNNPAIQNIKNDITVWGTRKSTLGNDLPIHMRFALDKKPKQYKSIQVPQSIVDAYNKKNNLNLKAQQSKLYTIDEYDWRELIFQMAQDYSKYNWIADFNSYISEANPEFENGITGYEDYYVDMRGFWRQLYNPEPKEGEKLNYFLKGENYQYWNKNAINNPEVLNFWFDFLDTDGEIMKYSVPAIGRRPKAVSDQDVKFINSKTVPNIIFYEKDEDKNKKSGYTYFKITDNFEKYLDLGGFRKSAAEAIDTLFYQNVCAQEAVSLTCIPIYYLQPNTKILLKDDQNLDINGKYQVTKITVPLTHNGTMSISAIKENNEF